MKTPTEILSEEHVNILKVIECLIRECDSLESGQKLDKIFFEKAVDFIQNYADKFHHAKEENILFVELSMDNVKMVCNPVGQMVYEHEMGREFVRKIGEGLEENSKKKVIENARGYAYLLKEHILKEDSILFPMADAALDPKTKKSILERFKKAENEEFNKDVKNRCMFLIKELEVKDD